MRIVPDADQVFAILEMGFLWMKNISNCRDAMQYVNNKIFHMLQASSFLAMNICVSLK